MKRGFFGLLASVLLLFTGVATAGPVEVLGGLNVSGTSGVDGITFPDGTKQRTAGVTSVETNGGLTITGSGMIEITPSGVADSMLATGISGSKIIAGSISQSQIAPVKAPVLNTGQLITYAAGDDGNFKYGAAVSNHFTDNGNGTVTDNLTSLIWLKDANCIGAQTWADALAQANALASGACSGGLTDGSAAGDWRLPNSNELESLVDASKSSPALPTGNPFTNVQSFNYWSSTTYAPLTAYSWFVDMYDGDVYNYIKSSIFYVWPVRGGRGKIGLPKTGETATYGTGSDGSLQKGVAWPSPRFTDNGNGTVTDNLTSLIWLKSANCIGAQTWANALAQADGLANGACGGGLTDGSAASDWRLPNRKELKSLVDASKSSPALPTGNPFTNVQTYCYWSSTTFAVSTGGAWFVDMFDGFVDFNGKSTIYYVWPVRGGQ